METRRGFLAASIAGVTWVGWLREARAATVAERVTRIVVEKLGVEEGLVVPYARFVEDLGADSLDKVELIMEFEREFEVEISDEVGNDLKTVGDAIGFLERVHS